eukprot:CAMPEP_0206250158 /NCGR_PEP_ID=MMETSP0047_2-20121206/21314_1 /ASSEMBLY_ACC=CAM_ASM_000192 /TAXON_ID=195065 /ORGANISM="Chroomonas mesostigmatica_cf, Strain CCMP1168" /LENGTH=135 /DNA_ID=CAMNT_0053675971 /DNA_START=73 /DNA_END=480 /DNA_ORIENTATION=+
MGGWKAIESYLTAMVAMTDATSCLIRGMDQGFHNQLYYTGVMGRLDGVESLRVNAFGEGEVITIGTSKRVKRNSRGLVINSDGTVAPVVHQFNRHRAIQYYYFGPGEVFDPKDGGFLPILREDLRDAYPAGVPLA